MFKTNRFSATIDRNKGNIMNRINIMNKAYEILDTLPKNSKYREFITNIITLARNKRDISEKQANVIINWNLKRGNVKKVRVIKQDKYSKLWTAKPKSYKRGK